MKLTLAILLGVVVLTLILWGRRGNVSSEEARKLVAEGASLLDVRTQQEFAAGHIEGALNIPLQELQQRLHELPKDRPVVVYCRSGNRSSSAAKLLENQGYSAVHDLGGMSRW